MDTPTTRGRVRRPSREHGVHQRSADLAGPPAPGHRAITQWSEVTDEFEQLGQRQAVGGGRSSLDCRLGVGSSRVREKFDYFPRTDLRHPLTAVASLQAFVLFKLPFVFVFTLFSTPNNIPVFFSVPFAYRQM